MHRTRPNSLHRGCQREVAEPVVSQASSSPTQQCVSAEDWLSVASELALLAGGNAAAAAVQVQGKLVGEQVLAAGGTPAEASNAAISAALSTVANDGDINAFDGEEAIASAGSMIADPTPPQRSVQASQSRTSTAASTPASVIRPPPARVAAVLPQASAPSHKDCSRFDREDTPEEEEPAVSRSSSSMSLDELVGEEQEASRELVASFAFVNPRGEGYINPRGERHQLVRLCER